MCGADEICRLHSRWAGLRAGLGQDGEGLMVAACVKARWLAVVCGEGKVKAVVKARWREEGLVQGMRDAAAGCVASILLRTQSKEQGDAAGMHLVALPVAPCDRQLAAGVLAPTDMPA